MVPHKVLISSNPVYILRLVKVSCSPISAVQNHLEMAFFWLMNLLVESAMHSGIKDITAVKLTQRRMAFFLLSDSGF